ncbi:MAG: HAMP domain-containing protein [Nocardioidaceae bacterium]
MPPWRRRTWELLQTFRFRTTVIALAVVSLAFLAGAAVLLGLLRAELERSRDAAAQARVEELAALAATDAAPPTLTVPDEDDVSQVVDSAGTVIAGSPGHKDKPVASFESGVGETLVQDVPQIRDGQELESFRVWAMTVEGPEGPVTAYFAVSKESVDEILSTLRSLLVTGLPLLLVAFGFSAWFLLGRALRPVEQIRAEVDNITAEALNRRVPQPKTDDEIGRLATTMNTMLDRLQASNAQQRQLLADVAHELQSPRRPFGLSSRWRWLIWMRRTGPRCRENCCVEIRKWRGSSATFCSWRGWRRRSRCDRRDCST